MIVIGLLVAAAVFGGADQYLGSIPALSSWGVATSLLSAPWLLVAFLAGWSQSSVRGAAALGAGCTLTALLGYGLMTWSPIEGAHLTWAAAVAFVSGERLAFLGGAVTGPLFGWFGHRWRTRRAWVGASIAAGAFLLEPAAHVLVHDPVNSVTVSRAEIAAGMIMIGYVAATAVRTHLRPSQEGSTQTG